MRMPQLIAQLICVPILASACMMGAANPSAFGRDVTVYRSTDAGDVRTRGELLAVSRDSIWVREDSSVARLTFAAADRVSVKRHDLTVGKGLVWSLIAGAGTGAALAISCASYSGESSCGGIMLGTVATTMVIGGVFSLTLGASSHTSVLGANWERLTPYARYPQGMPGGNSTSPLSMTTPPSIGVASHVRLARPAWVR